MDTIHRIRDEYHRKGKNVTQIAQEIGHDRKTIRKYIHQDDFNESPKISKPDGFICPPKLEPFQELIDEWLLEDKASKKKQRHTAKRVYDRLRTEDDTKALFDCSYRTVALYVAAKKKEIYETSTESALPLVHKAGEAQVDFGDAQFYEHGILHNGKYLNVVFPQSNQGFLQLFYGENAECFYEGLRNIFVYIGGIPNKIWLDNMSVVVTKIFKGGGRKLTDRFLRFANHYGFEFVFCNPDSGNEKGCVENKVGYNRRNMLVPVPRFEELSAFNRELLDRCTGDGQREHYRKNARISELFEQDKHSLLSLPAAELDVAGYKHLKTDKYGYFYLNEKKHAYSTAPKYAVTNIIVKLTSCEVIVLDESHREVIRHRRLYGDAKAQSMDWIPYLSQVARRPRALKYTGIYEMMPEKLKGLIDGLDTRETGDILKMLVALTKKTSFNKTMETVERAINLGATDADSLLSLHSNLNDDLPKMPMLCVPRIEPSLVEPNCVNLKAYDVPMGSVGGDPDGN
jgi:transposase